MVNRDMSCLILLATYRPFCEDRSYDNNRDLPTKNPQYSIDPSRSITGDSARAVWAELTTRFFYENTTSLPEKCTELFWKPRMPKLKAPTSSRRVTTEKRSAYPEAILFLFSLAEASFLNPKPTGHLQKPCCKPCTREWRDRRGIAVRK